MVDSLAKYGSSKQPTTTEGDNTMFWETPPDFILHVFNKDKLGKIGLSLCYVQ